MLSASTYLSPKRSAVCPCGSGKKYKRCCGKVIREQQAAPAASAGQRLLLEGNSCLNRGQYDEAIRYYDRAVALDRSLHPAYGDLGIVLEAKGLWQEAVAVFQKTVEHTAGTQEAARTGLNFLKLIHNYQVHLFGLQRTVAHDPTAIFAEHVRFGRQIEAMMRPSWREHGNPPDPERRLRVGYVSPDFRKHSVAYFIEPVIAQHDRDRVEVFCYYTCPVADTITKHFEAIADHWLDCNEIPPMALADRMRADGVDILVDLAGHTHSNRALTFALKPAPIQIAYLGYPATTGLTAIDYRLTDILADPDGMADPFFVEKPLRLAPAMTTYRPGFGPTGLLGEDALPVQSAPLLRNGHVTFGCFNDVSKHNEALIATWARLLTRVAGSKLILKSSHGLEERQEALRASFAANGIGPDRVEFFGRDADTARHLLRYSDIDISLDTFPYNGVTTSHESLWMGVPFITLPGLTPASRMGVSIATNVGHPEWVACSRDDYVAKAAALAADPQRLNEIRLGLRGALSDSPLMDGAAFTRKLEAVYRQVWRDWCANRGSAAS
jgi:predicted O-linked N-acetylglucosamine transferase (SPINDLY family)